MNENEQKQDNSGLGLALINAWGVALQLPLRRRIGRRYLGMNVALALVGTMFYGALLVAPAVLVWGMVLFVSLLVHRVCVLMRWGKDMEPHSYFVGIPWAGRLIAWRCQDSQIRCVAEPLLMFVLGLVLSPLGEATAAFFIIGAVCMGISAGMIELREVNRRDDLRDAVLDGQVFSPNKRKRRW